MPLKRCQNNKKKGWKWGDSGKCYTGKDAREKARKQGIAIKLNQEASDVERLIRRFLSSNGGRR